MRAIQENEESTKRKLADKKLNREAQFDFLRAFAALAVVMIHICAMDWKDLDVNSSQWLTIHVYDMLSKFSVPIFFMVSGRFFLDPQRRMTAQKLKQKLLRLAIAFAFWSLIYAGLDALRVISAGQSLWANLKWIAVDAFAGEYHMWFLYAIGGLYLITPILRIIVRDRRMTEYFLLLFAVFGLLWPMLSMLPKVGVIFTTIGEKTVFHFAVGYSGYFVLGHYLHQYRLNSKLRNMCYLLGIAGAVFTVMATYIYSVRQGAANEELAAYLSANVAVTAAAVYVFAEEMLAGKKPGKLVSLLSDNSFGVYLVHPLILWVFEWINISPAAFAPAVLVPVWVAAVSAGSLLLAWLCRRIPWIGKYLT